MRCDVPLAEWAQRWKGYGACRSLDKVKMCRKWAAIIMTRAGKGSSRSYPACGGSRERNSVAHFGHWIASRTGMWAGRMLPSA